MGTCCSVKENDQEMVIFQRSCKKDPIKTNSIHIEDTKNNGIDESAIMLAVDTQNLEEE